MKKVLIIPGLGEYDEYVEMLTRCWRKYGLEPVIHQMHWSDGEHFALKLEKLVAVVDALSKDGSVISLVGLSAGASAALNLFLERDHAIDRVVSICGRIRKGDQTGYRSFETRTKSSRAFAESVMLFAKEEKSLSVEQRKRIMTVRPLFGDALVPASTTHIDGARNVTIPTAGHIFSIGMSLSICSRPILQFLNA